MVGLHQILKAVGERFVEALQAYQQVEQDYKERYKQRTERQFKISERFSPIRLYGPLMCGSKSQSSLTPRRKRCARSWRTMEASRYSKKQYVLDLSYMCVDEMTEAAVLWLDHECQRIWPVDDGVPRTAGEIWRDSKDRTNTRRARANIQRRMLSVFFIHGQYKNDHSDCIYRWEHF